jgi:hypothetical protein
MVSDWLSSDRSGTWLFILDNVDDASVLVTSTVDKNGVAASSQRRKPSSKLLASYIPQGKHGSVLVTSRFRQAEQSIVDDYRWLYKVDGLSAADAVRLLQQKLALDKIATAACAEDFVRALECILLAITQAAAYIHELAPRMLGITCRVYALPGQEH